MKTMSVPPDTILQTKRLVLRHLKMEDAVTIFSVVSSPEFPELLPLKEMDSLHKIETWLTRLSELWEEGQGYSWIMEERDSGRLLGQVTLSKLEGDNKWALAFWTHPDHWRKGFATEGAKRIMRFGFEVLEAQTIWAAAGKWNLGSNRVLEKLGLRNTGDNSQGYYSKGIPVATSEYEISR